MSHKHTAMEAPLRSLQFTEHRPKEVEPPVTPPTMAPLLKC